ncbi:hypothetical protein [Carboxylicivirga sp. RSCT41]|uniref:hypothetical protein n=1 Tax=Carboxylicivirga agarovorans TaxID=3417570 RepID=UPI003D3435F2
MIYFEFNHEKQVICSSWTGQVQIDEIYEYIDRLAQLRTSYNCLYILQDDTRSEILINHTRDLHRIIAQVLEHLSCFNKVCMAHIVGGPQQTVLAMMYKEYLKDSPLFINEAFSTPDAGLKWLKEKQMINCCLATNSNYGPDQCQRQTPCETAE